MIAPGVVDIGPNLAHLLDDILGGLAGIVVLALMLWFWLRIAGIEGKGK